MLETHRRDQIAMLVHDLRHPLSSLRLVAELLEGEELSPEERADSIETIRRMCADMSRLVDGMLAASRLEAGVFAVDKRKVQVGDVMAPMLAMFRHVAARRRIAVTWEGRADLVVDADPPKLRQAIDNLVANAVKFAPKGGKVRVRTGIAGEGRAKRFVLEVADDGPGVPADERAHVFDPYRQGKRGRALGGSGLGLAIVRGISEAHGGGVEVGESDLGGASFRLWVPA
jgi:signal transduction histidine kinase